MANLISPTIEAVYYKTDVITPEGYKDELQFFIPAKQIRISNKGGVLKSDTASISKKAREVGKEYLSKVKTSGKSRRMNKYHNMVNKVDEKEKVNVQLPLKTVDQIEMLSEEITALKIRQDTLKEEVNTLIQKLFDNQDSI